MDILIRNVEPYTVKKINEMAKSKNLSQQNFLNDYLGDIHLYNFNLDEINNKYIDVINDLKDIIIENNKLMLELKQIHL